MYNFLLFLFFIVSISLILIILLQYNKFYINNSSMNNIDPNNVLGLRNQNNFITKVTSILAILFFVISLILNNFNNKQKKEENKKWNNIECTSSKVQENNVVSEDIPY